MAIELNRTVLRYIGAIFREGVGAELTDRQLLERFARRSSEASEPAFAALVARHGPMVLRVCRSVLRDEHDAQDAFQAVFLILVQKVGSLWVRDSLGPWLHAVALRVSASARDSALRRRSHERKHAELASQSIRDEGGVEKGRDELSAVIHDEVGRLPARYRAAVVLCDLEGLTHEEAAWRLGWPVGTVKSRQARGRTRLRSRLLHRGLAPLSGTVLAVISSEQARAAVPTSLGENTVKIAVLVAQGSVPAGVISAATAALTKGAIRAMFLSRLRGAVSVVFLLGTAATGVGWTIHTRVLLERLANTGVLAQPSPSPLDALTAADIPAEKRGAELPENVVAVLGDLRGRHAGEVRGLAMSPDGKLIATIADDDKKVRLWDAETLRPLAALAGNRASVNCVAISPTGHWLAAGSAYGDFFVWDLSTTPPKGPTLLPTRGKDNIFNNQIHAVAFSHDGKRLAVAGSAKSVDLFDMSGAQPVERGVLPGVDQEVHSLTFSPDGTTLALAGSKDGSVRLWDVTGAGPRAKATLRAPISVPLPPFLPRPEIAANQEAPMPPPADQPRSSSTISVAFAPNGKILAALEQDGSVRLWDLSKEDPMDRGLLRIPADGGHRAIYSLSDHSMVAFAPNGNTLAAAQTDGSIWLADLKGDEPIERAVFPAHKGVVTVLTFSPDGKTLISGGRDHLLRTWDLGTTVPREKVKLNGPIGGLRAVAFSPDGKMLAVGGDDELVRLWDLADPYTLSRLPSPKRVIDAGTSWPLAFSPDGKMLVCGQTLWDVGGNEPAKRSVLTINRPIPAAGVMPSRDVEGIWSLAFAPDGKTLATSGNDHRVRLWDLTGAEPKEWLALDGDDQWPPVVAISPGSDHLAFSGPEHSIRLWDLTGAEPHERARLNGTGWPISSLAFSPNGKILTAGTNGGTRLWDMSGENPKALHWIRWLSDLTKGCFGFSVAFTRDGTRLIAADELSQGGRQPSKPAVCVYDVASGRRLHEWDLSAPCWAIALAPDGRFVAAAQRDGVTVILRLPTAQRQ
ncbi:MAG: sigma-70 family RNA polymerase sigma factor [Isosphaerales bacterium]